MAASELFKSEKLGASAHDFRAAEILFGAFTCLDLEARTAHHQADRNGERQRQREADQHAADRGEDVEQRFGVAEDRRDLAQR